MSPCRVQRRRTAGWSAPLDAEGRKPIYVGRGSQYGNPWRIDREPGSGLWIVHVAAAGGVRARTLGDYQFRAQARRAATEAFEASLRTPGGAEQAEVFAEQLRGRDLMCWCPLPEVGEPDWCHGAVLLRLANT